MPRCPVTPGQVMDSARPTCTETRTAGNPSREGPNQVGRHGRSRTTWRAGRGLSRTAKSPPATRTRSIRRRTAMAKLGKSKTEKAKEAMGKKTNTEKARAKLAEKTDKAGKKMRKADR